MGYKGLTQHNISFPYTHTKGKHYGIYSFSSLFFFDSYSSLFHSHKSLYSSSVCWNDAFSVSFQGKINVELMSNVSMGWMETHCFFILKYSLLPILPMTHDKMIISRFIPYDGKSLTFHIHLKWFYEWNNDDFSNNFDVLYIIYNKLTGNHQFWVILRFTWAILNGFWHTFMYHGWSCGCFTFLCTSINEKVWMKFLVLWNRIAYCELKLEKDLLRTN